MKNKIVIAGGTGFIGQYLQQKYENLGFEVLIIARKHPYITWDNKTKIINALENADLLINLAGKSVDCRYNEKNKKEILSSRLITTKALGEALLQCKNPPELWINASTATIYRHAEDRAMTENGGEIGTGFSVGIAKAWEKAFFDFKPKKTRQIALRIAIVLGKDGGVVKPISNLVKLGLGGKQGNGKQMFSWIHIEDLYQIINFCHKKKELTGIFNCSSPTPVTNKNLMRVFQKTINIPFALPTPKWMLEIGAFLINTETELILKSRWVIPEKLSNLGFQFKYPKIEHTLKDVCN